jgi:hypothetical protein
MAAVEDGVVMAEGMAADNANELLAERAHTYFE